MGKEYGPKTPIARDPEFFGGIDDTFDGAGDSKKRNYRMPGKPEKLDVPQPLDDEG
jgi:hypothetical protein